MRRCAIRSGLLVNALTGNRNWTPVWREPEPEAALRRRDRRRRRARPRHRLLSRQGARHHQCRGAGEGLDRLRQCRPQHHDRPLQLPAARQHPVLRMVDEALGGAGAGPQLQRHGQPARRAQPLPFRRAARCLCAARQRHAAARRRCRAARPRAACARMVPFLDFDNARFPDPGRPAAAARRHGAPRRRGLGLCPRRRPAAASTSSRTARSPASASSSGRVIGVETTRGFIGAKKVGAGGAPATPRASPRMAGLRAADREPCAAGLRLGRHQAADRPASSPSAPGISTSASPTRAAWSSAATSTATIPTPSAATCRSSRTSCEGGMALMPAIGRAARAALTGAASWTCRWTARRSSTSTPIDGLYLNAGWCYGGFKATPASGWCFAHLIARDEPHPVAAAFRLDRFATGRADRREGRRRAAQPALRTAACSSPAPIAANATLEEFTYLGDATVQRPDPAATPTRIDALVSTMSICATTPPGAHRELLASRRAAAAPGWW